MLPAFAPVPRALRPSRSQTYPECTFSKRASETAAPGGSRGRSGAPQSPTRSIVSHPASDGEKAYERSSVVVSLARQGVGKVGVGRAPVAGAAPASPKASPLPLRLPPLTLRFHEQPALRYSARAHQSCCCRRLLPHRFHPRPPALPPTPAGPCPRRRHSAAA